MRRLLQEMPLNYDFVIISRKPSSECELADFISDIKKHMNKITAVNTMSSKGKDTSVAIERQGLGQSHGLRNLKTGSP
jgi:RNase P protein component